MPPISFVRSALEESANPVILFFTAILVGVLATISMFLPFVLCFCCGKGSKKEGQRETTDEVCDEMNPAVEAHGHAKSREAKAEKKPSKERERHHHHHHHGKEHHGHHDERQHHHEKDRQHEKKKKHEANVDGAKKIAEIGLAEKTPSSESGKDVIVAAKGKPLSVPSPSPVKIKAPETPVEAKKTPVAPAPVIRPSSKVFVRTPNVAYKTMAGDQSFNPSMVKAATVIKAAKAPIPLSAQRLSFVSQDDERYQSFAGLGDDVFVMSIKAAGK